MIYTIKGVPHFYLFAILFGPELQKVNRYTTKNLTFWTNEQKVASTYQFDTICIQAIWKKEKENKSFKPNQVGRGVRSDVKVHHKLTQKYLIKKPFAIAVSTVFQPYFPTHEQEMRQCIEEYEEYVLDQ